MGRLIMPPDDEYNRELVNNVHPDDWVNPEPKRIYNMVVIGAGAAGLISSIATASLGGSVALIERNLLGGDCLNVGCVPSKSLIRSANAAHEMKGAARYGLSPSYIAKSDFYSVMERLRRVRAGISTNDSAARYTELGVDVFIGDGRFIDPNSVEVDGKVLRFKKAVITTGARAAIPDIQGIEDVGYYTNENIFDLVDLPEALIVIGGGPIGCELAQAFSRLGSKVSIIQRGKLLPHEDKDASAILEESFKSEGIELYSDSQALRVERGTDGKKILVIEKDGSEYAVVGDEILIGVGRVPNVEGMGLGVAGVEYDKKHGVKVDDNLRTTNKRVFAAGDSCMKWKFTHAADAAAQIVVQNALFKGKKKLSSLVMPWCTYTDPEIAHVGMYDGEAISAGIEYEYYKFDMAENDRARAEGDEVGFVKVMVEKGRDRILGATIVSKHAGEMINEITTCITLGIGLGKLGSVIHPYPTQSEAIKRVAGLYNKSRLTPFIAKLLKLWLRVQR